jgi:hypothetical protein
MGNLDDDSASFEVRKERLDEAVDSIKKTMSDPEMRALSQRAVQGKVWHLQPTVAVLSDLKAEESCTHADHGAANSCTSSTNIRWM